VRLACWRLGRTAASGVGGRRVPDARGGTARRRVAAGETAKTVYSLCAQQNCGGGSYCEPKGRNRPTITPIWSLTGHHRPSGRARLSRPASWPNFPKKFQEFPAYGASRKTPSRSLVVTDQRDRLCCGEAQSPYSDEGLFDHGLVDVDRFEHLAGLPWCRANQAIPKC